MLKKLLSLALLFLSVSCASRLPADSCCPLVEIPRDRAYLVQKINYSDEFQIELTGYEGFCGYDEKLDRHTAYITPRFRLYRLKDSDETRVDFEFYTETLQGPPEFLGKRIYSAGVNIGADRLEKDFNGPQVKVLVPRDAEDFPIILALNISSAQYLYNQRTFDMRYQYNLPEVQMIERTVYIEPAAAPVNQPAPESSGCNSCGL